MVETEEICTLRVLHLPPALSNERREELFRHYGAIKTKTIRKSEKYTISFVEFPTNDIATEAFLRLHQLPIKGRRLSIEFAKRNVSYDERKDNTEDDDNLKSDKESVNHKMHFQAFLKKLNTWAPHHLFSQPVPPFLKYKYPNPTRETLLRIAIQLVKEPAFYTQVLHLMNKMNLPPPFEGLDDEYPIIKEAYDFENYQDLFGFRMQPEKVSEQQTEGDSTEFIEEEDDEDESEMESDKESSVPELFIPQKNSQSKKRLKIPKFVNPLKQTIKPTTSRKRRREEVFELLRRDPLNRAIVMKPLEPKSKVLKSMTKIEEKPQFVITANENTEGFGLISPANKDDALESKEETPEFITTEQLHENRISTEDQRLLPPFKNYHPGKPFHRLYIKNLAKQVEENDLHFIYRRYVLPSSSECTSEYNVRLMQEGRMKGQAFITLPNVAQAQLALNETNGYILKDKPMVVQFAKVSKS